MLRHDCFTKKEIVKKMMIFQNDHCNRLHNFNVDSKTNNNLRPFKWNEWQSQTMTWYLNMYFLTVCMKWMLGWKWLLEIHAAHSHFYRFNNISTESMLVYECIYSPSTEIGNGTEPSRTELNWNHKKLSRTKLKKRAKHQVNETAG